MDLESPAPVSTPKQKRFGAHAPPTAVIEISGSDEDSFLGSADSSRTYIPGNNNTPQCITASEEPFAGAFPASTSSPLAYRLAAHVGEDLAPGSPSPGPSPPAARLFVTGFKMWGKRREVYTTMRTHFSQYGTVDILQLRHSGEKRNGPFAFVQYVNTAAAERACADSAAVMVGGWFLRVELAKIPRTIFLHSQFRGQPMDITYVLRLVSGHGPLEQVLAYNQYKTGWFVQFKFVEDATNAFYCIRDKGDTPCQWVENVQSPETIEAENKTTVYMSNFPPHVKWAHVRQFIEPYGVAVSIQVRFTQNKKTKYAYVKMRSAPLAAHLARSLNGVEYFGRSINSSLRSFVPRLKPTRVDPPGRLSLSEQAMSPMSPMCSSPLASLPAQFSPVFVRHRFFPGPSSQSGGMPHGFSPYMSPLPSMFPDTSMSPAVSHPHQFGPVFTEPNEHRLTLFSNFYAQEMKETGTEGFQSLQ